MASKSLPLAVLPVDSTMGAVFLGVVGASILFGITSLQAYLYYHHFRKDSMVHRASVGVLWALDSFHMALTIHAVYHYLIKGFGKVDLNIVWSIKMQVLCNVIIIVIVQSLYAFRVMLLGGYHHGVLGYLAASLVLGGFVIGIVLSYEIWMTDTFPDVNIIAWAIDSSLAASTGIDFILSLAMCYYLRKSRSKESRLNSRISTVMQYSLSSGLLTSACSLATVFTYTLIPNTLIYLGLEFLLTKLYVGSFLAMLNARQRSDGHQSRQELSSIGLPSLSIRTPTTRAYGSPISSGSEQKRAYAWDVERDSVSEAVPVAEPLAAAYTDMPQRNGRQKRQPDYMNRW